MMKTQPLDHHFTLNIAILTLCCSSLFAFGMLVGNAIPLELRHTLSYINLGLVIGFLVVNWIRLLHITRLPLLFGIALLGGISVTLWEQPLALAALGIVLLAGNLALITLLAQFRVFKLERFGLVLAMLALIFSFAGGLLVFAERLPELSLIWASAAFVCFSGLLYNVVSRVLHQGQEKEYQTHAASIFLLNIGLLANLVMVLGMLV